MKIFTLSQEHSEEICLLNKCQVVGTLYRHFIAVVLKSLEEGFYHVRYNVRLKTIQWIPSIRTAHRAFIPY